MTGGSEVAIRMVRAAFNKALADADLAAIGAFLAAEAILVTGTDSASIVGRKAQLAAWKREFAARSRTIYTRMPDAILLSPVEPIALEQGVWVGTAEAHATPLASGRYTAKWRRIADRWVIEAELYLTLA